MEGDTPLPLGSTCHRKRLHSAGEEEDEGRSRSFRPNPEGSVSTTELNLYSTPQEELRRLCQRCHIMTSQLNRQAAVLADNIALKVSNNTTHVNQWDKAKRPLIGCEEQTKTK